MRKFVLMILGTFMAISQLWAQDTRTVTGKVTDAQGNPVPAAAVQVKENARIGTTTGSDGTFRLAGVPANATALIIRSLNYRDQEISISGGRTDVGSVSLTLSDAGSLDEVVVTVPYGTVKKSAFTGSETTISTKNIEKQQVTSVTRAIEGLVPGVIATNGGGQPGTGATILIRGVGSVNATSTPLYVLNGVPYDGSIAAISTDDIETVTVLKDAAAAALYGSRAANGVIMITTKKGRKGRPAVGVTVRQGFMSRGIPEYDRLDQKEYYEMMWEGTRNAYVYASGQSFAQAGQTASNLLTGPQALNYNSYNVAGNTLVDPVTGKLNPNAQQLWNDSWEDALFRTAGRQNVNVNISGAGDKSDYYLSFGYLNEEGIMKFTGYKRYNGRVNVNTAATNWLNAGLNVDAAVADQETSLNGGTATSNPFYYSRVMGPIYPVYQRYAFGSTAGTPGGYILDASGNRQLDWGRADQMGARAYGPNSNLLGSLDLDDRANQVINANANTFMEVKFLKNFSFKTTLGINVWDRSATTFQNGQFGDADNVKGRSTKTGTRQFSTTLNEVLSWNKSFGNHAVRALVGHESYKFKLEQLSSTKTTFPFPETNELDNATIEEGSSSFTDNHRIEGYFANANYEYSSKYLLSASVRRDGTSRFFSENRWGTFYSAGIGWRITQEDFMKNVNWLNDLKLRASYGEQGNEGIGTYYAYQNLYSMGWNNALMSGATAGALPNRDLVWESNKTFNVGLDFSILKNRLQGTIEYFNRKSDNLLFDVQLPLSLSTGATSITKNVGTMVNKGIELQLGYNAIRAKNFDWRIDLNLTHFKNEITKMPPSQPELINGSKKLSVGHGIFDFFIREFAGVDAATGESLFYKDVLDANNKPTGQRTVTNIWSQGTLYYQGSALPKISGGVTNAFRYRNVELSFLLSFAYGGLFYDGSYQTLMHNGTYGTAWHKDILNRWQKPGDITNVPKVQNAYPADGASTRYLLDGSFLNVKNITLSYSLPKSVASRWYLSNMQVFANIDNAYLFTAKKGMDPQRVFNGVADDTYPPYRTVTFGLNVNF